MTCTICRVQHDMTGGRVYEFGKTCCGMPDVRKSLSVQGKSRKRVYEEEGSLQSD